MSRPTPSWGDIANFGANVYQSRQISRLASEQAESNAILQRQIEDMQMQQQIEKMRKDLLKKARALILDFENLIDSVNEKWNHNPVMASIEAEATQMAFDDAKLSGVNEDLFDEMYDLERFRNVESKIAKCVERKRELNPPMMEIKRNVILYTSQFDDLEIAIQLSSQLPGLRRRLEELDREVSEKKPEWIRFESNANRVNAEMEKKSNLAAGVLFLIGIAIFMLPPEFYGASSGSDLEASVGGGGCCLCLILIGLISSYYDQRKIAVPEIELLLSDDDSELADAERELRLYMSMDQELFADEIRDAEQKVARLQNEIGSEENFPVEHSGEPFEEYYTLLEHTHKRCQDRYDSVNEQLNELTEKLNESDPDKLQIMLSNRREYVEQFSGDVFPNIPVSTNGPEKVKSIVPGGWGKLKQIANASADRFTKNKPQETDTKIAWVLHEGYYYKQYEDGTFDQTPHVRTHEGLMVPYQSPRAPDDFKF